MKEQMKNSYENPLKQKKIIAFWTICDNCKIRFKGVKMWCTKKYSFIEGIYYKVYLCMNCAPTEGKAIKLLGLEKKCIQYTNTEKLIEKLTQKKEQRLLINRK